MKKNDMIELLKNSGRANDSLVVHLSPISAAILKSHGGLETINPITELPEYWGWSDFVEIFIPVAVIAVVVFAPELIPAIGAYVTTGSAEVAAAVLATDGSAAAVGGALAAAGVETSVATVTAAGAAATGASTNAINTAAQGGSAEDIAKAAVVGGVAGGAGSQVGSLAAEAVPSLGATGAAAVGGAAKGAITPSLTGGSVGSGAAGGAIGSALGTEIGGDAGKIIGGAAGSAAGAAAAGGDVGQSAVRGGLTGAAGAVGGALRQEFNPSTGQMETVQDTSTQPTPTTPPQPDIQEQQPSYAGDLGELTVSGSPDLVLPDTTTTSKDTTEPTSKSTTKQNKPQLISPTIVPSAGSPQVLSSVLGAPSSTILGQALQSSSPDPSTTGSPILDGDGGNVRNVWNTESLRTALGL
jgi:hypothetical protein